MTSPRCSLIAKITIGILVVLVGANAIWTVISKHPGSLIALIFYALVAFLCWQRSHFEAGVIGGVLGLGIHLYELLFQGIEKLEGIDSGLFFLNLLLPILLICFGYRAYQEVRH